MIERYSRPEMASLWSDEAKYRLWLEIEIAVCEAWTSRGEIPADSLATIRSKAGFDIDRIAAIEEEVRHDVIAFLTAVAEKVGPDSRYIHMGLTSSDLLDTAFAVQLTRAGKTISDDLAKLRAVISTLAHAHKNTVMIGRSHGIHAEPITFGLKCAIWYDEFGRHAARLEEAIKGVAVGKLSGAVGTFAHIDPSIEVDVCARLGLTAAPASSQIVQRDRHAHYFAVLAGIAASIEKVAVEIRHLQRTEVGEAAEPFGKGQKGSSAMPHKRNPILCENLTGLARVVRANAMAAFENVALWHERDISHSSVERIIGPDSTILVDFMLSRISRVLEGLEVNPERMAANMEMSHGLYNSQEVMLALVRGGMTREDAYRIVQATAMQSWKEGKPFEQILAANKEVCAKIPASELKKLFDVNIHLRHVDAIFKRVFRD
ncbi:MAG: adenylosuccinate lyase [bacterium]